ncbi:MAG: ATP-binding protein [Longimicrobiales bacterium]
MTVDERTHDSAVADLLERLARAATFDEACQLVIREARLGGQLPAALCVVWLDAGPVASAQHITQQHVDEFLQTYRDPETLLGAELARETAGIGPAVPIPELRLGAARVLSFDAGPQARAAVMMIVAGDADAESVSRLQRFLRRCGVALGRTAFLDVFGALRKTQGDQRELLVLLVNTLPDPVILTDGAAEMLFKNARAELLFGMEEADSEGRRRAVEINHLLFGSYVAQSVAGVAITRELNLVDPSDGSDLMFEVIAARVPDAVEASRLWILRDITDLRRAVGELEEQFSRSRAAEHGSRRERDQLNVVLENVTDPILVTDDKSNIILLNREGDRLFVAPEESVASASRRIVRTNDTRYTTLISDFLLQPARRRVGHLELTDPDSGRSFPAEVVSSKILNARGEPTAVVSVVHDLTQVVENQRLARELQELNEELEARIERATEQLAERNRDLEWQQRELEKASRLKSEFLASMSHELRTPINVILGYTSLMRERIYGDLTEQQQEALGKVYNTSQHLLELINDILDLSKIEAGKMPVHVEPIAVNELVEELSEQVRPLLQQRALSYRSELDPTVPTIRSDRTKLKQILLNLLSNAIKFTAEGSVVLRVVATDGGERVRISVADTGIGIKPDHLKTIFEDFRQVDQSATREYGGTGLGLSITKKLLSLLGGVVAVESTYGKGSTFSIELPLKLEPEVVEQQAQRAGLSDEDTVIAADRDGDGAASSLARNVERTRDAVSKVVKRLGGK